MMDDATLLETYARNRSDEAFGELVRRHLTLVYSAALRRTDGDVHCAKDVAQIVFTALARDAAALSRHAALTGWFYTATRNAAIDIMRAERRRRQREEEVLIMEQISLPPETPPDWEQLRPVLDDVMDELDGPDREAVLLRFFEGRPFAAVATALRVSEDAARKRVDRALDKLGALLARRGITSTGGALAVLLANEVAVAAPAGVAATITTVALAGTGAAAGGAGAAGIFIMSTSKTVMGITVAVALVAIGTAVYQTKAQRASAAETSALSAERDALRARLGTAEQSARQSDDTLATTRKELADLRARAPDAPATPAARPPVTQGAAMDYVLEHPETHASYLQQQVLRAKLRY
ncbi:MAG: sigma-70 family RNA polymerase sigma factor, partial [Pseudomonadota bacterium]